MKVESLIKEIYGIVEPMANELNLEIYHVEYVKENGEYYLRIYIDKDGGIFLSDCEALSRRVSDVLDEVDPIKEAYFLEVSSPGLNRRLFSNIEEDNMVGWTKIMDKKLSGEYFTKYSTNDGRFCK